MDNRNYHFGTFGEALHIFDEDDVDKLLDSMFDGVSSGDYFSAFNAALNKVDSRLQLGDGYSKDNSIAQVKNYDIITPLFIALIFIGCYTYKSLPVTDIEIKICSNFKTSC